MFLPADLTSSEEDLAATVTRQLLEHRRPATPEQEAQVRQEAVETAAEMIHAQRAELSPEEPDGESPTDSAWLRFRQELLEKEQRLVEDEAEEIEARRLG